MSDDYEVQNSYRYTRRSYKETRDHDNSIRDEINVEIDPSPRTAGYPANCSCVVEPEGEIAHILHKKCPVISLAQHQLQRLLDSEELVVCNNRNIRTLLDVLRYVKQCIAPQNRLQCLLLLGCGFIFFCGLMTGAATCGSYSGRFESPIISCVDNYFISDGYNIDNELYRCIV